MIDRYELTDDGLELSKNGDWSKYDDMEKLEKELAILADHIYDWCKAIEKESSWDSWDYYYKEAYYRKENDIYKLVRKYMSTGDKK